MTRRKQQNAQATTTGQNLVHTETAINGFSDTSARTHGLITEEREDHQLLEKILGRDNMFAALARVEKNNGAAGMDGMEVKDLRTFLKEEWPGVRNKILTGSFRPSPARRVEIPKPGGGTRLLGIPTALDRLIQQAMLQMLSPIFDPGFSNH